jgi:hypothetical protein
MIPSAARAETIHGSDRRRRGMTGILTTEGKMKNQEPATNNGFQFYIFPSPPSSIPTTSFP